MSSPRYDSVEITDAERDVLNMAISAIGFVLKADVLLLLCADATGIFLQARPGCESEIADVLQTIDWQSLVHVMKEHSR